MIVETKTPLAEAFTLDASLRTTSLDEADLISAWDSRRFGSKQGRELGGPLASHPSEVECLSARSQTP
jgi:hypothetical protein